MIFVESLEIDDQILEKIEAKHGVSFDEVEAACYSEKRRVRRGKEGLYKFFGQTEVGRYVLVVLAHHGMGSWKVVTARDMTNTENVYTKRPSESSKWKIWTKP